MDEYIVSLNVVSRRHTLAEISGALGLMPASDCPERGQVVPSPLRGLQKRFTATCWRLESGVRRTARLHRHFEGLFARIPATFALRLRRLKLDKPALVSIGIFTSRPMKTIVISQDELERFRELGCELEVIYYSDRPPAPTEGRR